MDESSPTARALRALEIVSTRPGTGAEELGRRLGVTSRAARRYVAVLREAGIVVESAPGPGGGYRIGRGLRAAPVSFTDEELLALTMAVLEVPADADDATTPAALAKLLQALPRTVATPAMTLRAGATAVPTRSRHRPDAGHTLAVVAAATDRHQVRLDYRLPDGRQIERDVEPWAVVVRRARWYLLCRSVADDATRAYRLDRVVGVERRAATFTPPTDLDPVAWLETHLSQTWDHPVVVEVDAPAAQVRAWVPGAMGDVEALDDERSRLRGTTSNPAAYAADLCHFPVDFRVVEGDEVRRAVEDLRERLARATP